MSTPRPPWRIELRGRVQNGPMRRRWIDVGRTPWSSHLVLRGTLALDDVDTEWVARSLLPERYRVDARVTYQKVEQRPLRRARWVFVFHPAREGELT